MIYEARGPPYPSVCNTAIRMAVWMLATARSAPMMRHAIVVTRPPSFGGDARGEAW